MVAGRTICIGQDGPANALALHRDYGQVVIAGRNVFKVYTIEEECFVEKCNLRVGKNLNLNFSCNDVVWSTLEEDLLATAATNGVVVVWNLSRASRMKQEHVFHDHKRTVNKVSFHPNDQHLLISGSQDGTVKVFDLRTRAAKHTFLSNSESVRDVQVSPHNSNTFAAVSENGSVQLWDFRRPDRMERQFTAHSGPVFACDWHPDMTWWLATAGRDKTIKVWDLSAKPTLEYTIQTIASVGRIRWRPARKFHIASCALVVDSSINIWDVRRPYIPFAAFDQHRDVATGIAWRGEPHLFLSTGKDCMLYQHAFHDASRPASHANPQGLKVSTRGDVSFASKLPTTVLQPYNPSSKVAIFRKTPSLGDQFCVASSCLQIFRQESPLPSDEDEHDASQYGNAGADSSSSTASDAHPSSHHSTPLRSTPSSPPFVVVSSAKIFLTGSVYLPWFAALAKGYILGGKPFGEICEHNAALAMANNRPHTSMVWKMLRLMYPESLAELKPTPTGGTVQLREDVEPSRHLSGGGGAVVNSAVLDKDASSSAKIAPPEPTSAVNTGGMSGGEEETETDEQDIDMFRGNMLGFPTLHRPGNASAAAAYFGEPEEAIPFDYDLGPGGVSGAEDWSLPTEAFQPRHDLLEAHSPPPAEQYAAHHHHAHMHNHDHEPASPEVNDSENRTVTDEDPLRSLLNTPALVMAMWEPTEITRRMLEHHASIGDIQTSVSVLAVLGERARGIVDEAAEEHWYLSYIDMLDKFQLWTEATKVLRACWLPSVHQLNHQSTTVHSGCGECHKPVLRSGWWCDSCHAMCSICSLCHAVVRGLYVWCQGCGHGGHLAHMRDWFHSNRQCPTGCGHACEWT